MVKEKTKYKTIENFIEDYPSRYTQKTYRTQLYKFFDVLETNPDEYFNDKKDNTSYELDVKKFISAICNDPPKSRNIGIAAVKKFLEFYDIEFKNKFWTGINRKLKGRRAVTNDEIPTNQQLKQILQHADVKGKALFLTLASSGMRIGETLQLKVDEDLHLDNDPPSIDIRRDYSKTGNSRIVFISNEAKESILEWLKVRDFYIKSTARKCKKINETLEKDGKKPLVGLKSEDDNRLFPFVGNVAQVHWRNIITKAGFIERDNNTRQKRYKFHIHGLRKFFSNRMTIAGVPESFTEIFMGHEDGMRNLYKNYNSEQKVDLYKQGLKELLIFETSANGERLTELEERVKRYDELFRNIDSDALVELFRKDSPMIEEIREAYKKQDKVLWISQETSKERKDWIEKVKSGEIEINDPEPTEEEKKKILKSLREKKGDV